MSLHLTFIIFTLDHKMLRDYFNHFAQTSDEAKSYFAACQAELVNGEVLTSPTLKKKKKKVMARLCYVCVTCAVSIIVVKSHKQLHVGIIARRIHMRRNVLCCFDVLSVISLNVPSTRGKNQ